MHIIHYMLLRNIKKGLYPLFEERAEDISSVIYKEAGSSWYRTEDSAVSEEVLRGNYP